MEAGDGGLSPETCEKFLTIHTRILHPQHAHMLDVKHSLIHLLGHFEGYLMADLTDKQLQLKEDSARSILSIAERLLPGEIFIPYYYSNRNLFTLILVLGKILKI